MRNVVARSCVTGTLALGNAIYGTFDDTRNTDRSLALVPGIPLQLAVDFNKDPGMHAVVGQYLRERGLRRKKRRPGSRE